MKKIICNSVQSFWDMADNELLENLDVHCVFPVTEGLKAFILNYQKKNTAFAVFLSLKHFNFCIR